MYYIYKLEKPVGRTTIFQRCKSRTLTNTKVFIPLIMLYNFTKKEFEFYFVFDFKQQMSSAADSVCVLKSCATCATVFSFIFIFGLFCCSVIVTGVTVPASGYTVECAFKKSLNVSCVQRELSNDSFSSAVSPFRFFFVNCVHYVWA